MNGPATLAAHLDDNLDAVVELWRSVVERAGDVPRASSLTHGQFLDHVPSLIDRMISRLRGQAADVSTEAEKHGHERWLQGYDIVELLNELAHLRTALVHATFKMAHENRLDLKTLETAHEAIHNVLNEAQAESVRQFQDDSEVRQNDVLSEIESRRRELEESTKAAELERSKLQVLLESIPLGVWVSDADGRIINLNRAAETLQLLPATATVDRVMITQATPLFQFYRTDGTGYLPTELPLARALRGEIIDQEEMVWSQPEGMRIILASARPLLDASGHVIGGVAVAQDMTLKHRLKSELAASTAQLKGIVEQSPVMIWRTGPDGRNNFVNRTYLDYLGIPLEMATSDRWLEVVHPEDRDGLVASFLESYHSRTPFEREYRVLDRHQRWRWMSSRGIPFFDERSTFLGYLGTCIDINDQHELEAALQRQKEIAEESSIHKTRLMSALSHDARTPLNAVVLSAQLLEMHIQDGEDPEVGECLRTIRNGVKNVLDLLGDMLDLTRIDAGAMPIDLTQFEIDQAIIECASSIQTAARLKGLHCFVELDGLKNQYVFTDRAKFKQILSNFLSNALRYTDQGEIRVRGELTKDQIRVSVEDTGVGIAENDLTRVFDEFATLESPRRNHSEGTGLGLAICRRLAGLLGGELELQSKLSEGSRFTLMLPISALRFPEPSGDPSATIVSSPSNGCILIVEDHADSRKALGRVLRKMGYRVQEAADGYEALDLARSERPQAILMDVNMPGMDGIDATLAIRNDPQLRHVAIFALTGDVTAENQRRIEEVGVQGYLEKPVTSEALRSALSTIATLSSDRDGLSNSFGSLAH